MLIVASYFVDIEYYESEKSQYIRYLHAFLVYLIDKFQKREKKSRVAQAQTDYSYRRSAKYGLERVHTGLLSLESPPSSLDITAKMLWTCGAGYIVGPLVFFSPKK